MENSVYFCSKFFAFNHLYLYKSNKTKLVYCGFLNSEFIDCFRLGGPDPLDYISMYANPGVPHENIPPHWHYIR